MLKKIMASLMIASYCLNVVPVYAGKAHFRDCHSKVGGFQSKARSKNYFRQEKKQNNRTQAKQAKKNLKEFSKSENSATRQRTGTETLSNFSLSNENEPIPDRDKSSKDTSGAQQSHKVSKKICLTTTVSYAALLCLSGLLLAEGASIGAVATGNHSSTDFGNVEPFFVNNSTRFIPQTKIKRCDDVKEIDEFKNARATYHDPLNLAKVTTLFGLPECATEANRIMCTFGISDLSSEQYRKLVEENPNNRLFSAMVLPDSNCTLYNWGSGQTLSEDPRTRDRFWNSIQIKETTLSVFIGHYKKLSRENFLNKKASYSVYTFQPELNASMHEKGSNLIKVNAGAVDLNYDELIEWASKNPGRHLVIKGELSKKQFSTVAVYNQGAYFVLEIISKPLLDKMPAITTAFLRELFGKGYLNNGDKLRRFFLYDYLDLDRLSAEKINVGEQDAVVTTPTTTVSSDASPASAPENSTDGIYTSSLTPTQAPPISVNGSETGFPWVSIAKIAGPIALAGVVGGFFYWAFRAIKKTEFPEKQYSRRSAVPK
jgi:hypothetical protein